MMNGEKEIFSAREQEVLKVLGRKKLLIVEITEMVFGKKKAPIGANNGIGSAIRRINEKCRYHKLPWFLNGMGVGRAGKAVWKDRN